ncbi:MAG: cupin domain-containing protein [bacterium]|nr:cupin domain-containing protein [bacterium]
MTTESIAIAGWRIDAGLRQSGPGSCTGSVVQGPARLSCSAGEFMLSTGMYFTVPGDCEIEGGSGWLIRQNDFQALFQIGGPAEETGRLTYIDGCTDTLLISPPVYGDPCLNLLHIPSHTRQTRHNHPSLRAGVIAGGSGHCVTPSGRIALFPGMVFHIPTGVDHSFHTDDSALRVFAYHPDSDFGPKHVDHPMVNRTIIGGVSAARRPAAAPEFSASGAQDETS